MLFDNIHLDFQFDQDGVAAWPEDLAVRTIRDCLEQQGPGPYSLCQLRLDAPDLAWLKKLTCKLDIGEMLKNKLEPLGLLLVLLATEINRREAEYGSFWDLLAQCNELKQSRDLLFDKSDNPKPVLKTCIEKACETYRLRNVFRQQEIQKWMISGYLQFGLPRGRIVDPKNMYQPTKAAEILLEDEELGSDSFRQLWQTLYRYQKNPLSREGTKAFLESSEWVVGDWIDEILARYAGKSSYIVNEQNSFLLERTLVGRPRLCWEGEKPVFVSEILDINGFGLSSGIYDLKNNENHLARWAVQQGRLTCHSRQIELSPDYPSHALELSDRYGEVHEKQVVELWNPDEVIQLFNAQGLLVKPCDYQSLIQTGKYFLRYPLDGRLTGDAVFRINRQISRPSCQWAEVTGLNNNFGVRDGEGKVIWNPQALPPPPGFVAIRPVFNPPKVEIGQPVEFTVANIPTGCRVHYVRLNGMPVDYDANINRGRIDSVTPEMAVEKCSFRIAIDSAQHRTPIHRTVSAPVTAALIHGKDGWRSFIEKRFLSVRLVNSGYFRFCDAEYNPEFPLIFCEGARPMAQIDLRGRQSALPLIVGTGEQVSVYRSPLGHNPKPLFVFGNGVDSGILRDCRVTYEKTRLLLNLVHPIEPDGEHRVHLWNTDGSLQTYESEQIVTLGEEKSTTCWGVDYSEKNQKSLTAISYNGKRVGTNWLRYGLSGLSYRLNMGEIENPIREAALVRWFKLPVLKPANQVWNTGMPYPWLSRFVGRFPNEFLAAWLWDEGLPEGLVHQQDERSQTYVNESIASLFLGLNQAIGENE